jgi:PKD repeat protein
MKRLVSMLAVLLVIGLVTNLYAKTLFQNTGVSQGLVAYWSFDNCDARDDSGNGHDGEINGEPECVEGVVGKALRFNGNDYITINNVDGLSFENEFTITALVQPERLYNGWIVVLTKGITMQSEYDVVYKCQDGICKPHIRFTSDVDESYVHTEDTINAINLNQWNFITWRFKDGMLSIFLNGNLILEKLLPFEKLKNSEEPLEIGRDLPGNTEFLYGILDEIRIYNRALTDEEIKTLYGEVSANQPPQITSLTANPTSGYAPLTVTFTCQATDPDGYVTEYRWDFDGDGQIDMTTPPSTTDYSGYATYTYQTAGTYQATCTVVDDQGAVASASVTIEVEEAANQPPQITSLTANPTSGYAPLTVTFTCQATDPDGYVTAFRWDFDGDGQIDMTTDHSGYATYTYQTAGTYQATCMAVDDQGAVASASVTIEVEEYTPTTPFNAAPATPMTAHTLTNPAMQPADVIVLSGAQKEQVIVEPSLIVPEDRRGQNVTLYWLYCTADGSWCSETYSLGNVLLAEDTVSFPIVTTPLDFSYLEGDFLIFVGFATRADFLDVVYNYYEVRFE